MNGSNKKYKRRVMDNDIDGNGTHDVSIFILTIHDEYVDMDEYNRTHDGESTFIRVTNDILESDYGDDNSICICRDWRDRMNDALNKIYMSNKVFSFSDKFMSDNTGFVTSTWQTPDIDAHTKRETAQEIPDNGKYRLNADSDNEDTFQVSRYVEGRKTCLNIISNAVRLPREREMEGLIPAVMMAHDTIVNLHGRVLHGFLPAIGQLAIIDDNIRRINDALRMAGSTEIPAVTNMEHLDKWWWSSTEYDRYGAWAIYAGQCVAIGKSPNKCRILSLFCID